VTSREPRFIAHRHWNIRDAMYFSDYVATRLRDTDPDSTWGMCGRQQYQTSLLVSDAMLARRQICCLPHMLHRSTLAH
jgi:hypothetical protein